MNSPVDVERPLRIPVLLGTVRKGRMSERVAHVMADELSRIDDIDTELVDIAQLDVGFDDAGETAKDPKFATLVSGSDGFVVVVPEYNHGYPGALKHVLDTNYWEYAHRAVGLVGVSAGPIGGARAIENLVPIIKAVGLVPIAFDLNVGDVANAFDSGGMPRDPRLAGRMKGFLGELIWMSRTLRHGRAHIANPGRMT